MATLVLGQSQPPPSLDSHHDPPETLLHNVSIASYSSETPATREFTLFRSLPVELRHKIWHYAISVPRIVDMEKVPCWQHESLNTGYSYFADRWHYRIKNPPPLFSTCVESRNEALKVYQKHQELDEPTPNPPWIRCDYDILHLKAKRWDEEGRYVPHMWCEYDVCAWSYPGSNFSDGRYSAKRDCFKNLEALAINRELFFRAGDYVESVVRQLFPNLKLLIVLIDDEIDIESSWNIKDHAFEPYEGDPFDEPVIRRWAFTSASTGPFTPVSRNSWYRYFIETKMERYFQREQAKFQNYDPPYITIMGCALPAGLEIPSCGRLPA
ncbi:hypothetical protein LHYA1_G004930 [Lachnellula hyalina]|uniref:2EXR domain-containing protein n=1 Tax=Lachnellula hyalina TaxID=1316788 RepID=A0A8H8R0Q3_9HELO|nr:uncharacterized protein LHYA1_G004930 [Lachnellula hyalina]TVY26249.1 hypothetical protein LHYA1_G004930 [Lachnellula hyalina]